MFDFCLILPHTGSRAVLIPGSFADSTSFFKKYSFGVCGESLSYHMTNSFILSTKN